jgi:hypothetical protein
MKATSLLISLIFLFSLGVGVLAQEIELPDPGLTPDSPFYFLEIIAEEIGTFFTFGDLKKAERHAALAAERLAEAQVIAGKGKPELTEKTLARYEKQLEKSMARVEKAESKDKNTEKVMEVAIRVAQATSKHLEVLAEVSEKVPEEAKSAIENAMKASIKGHTKAVEILKAKNALGDVPESVSLPAQVPQEVRERIQERAQQELQIEEFLEEPAESFESVRNRCIEEGGPREMCEKIPLKGFKSFKELEDFCIGVGSPSEFCTVLEEQCKEVGVTTANECFRLLTATATTTYKAAEPTFVPASPSSEVSPRPTLPEEEMRREEETRTGFPYLGALYSTINDEMQAERGLPVNSGALLNSIVPDTPAARAGLKKGDIIIEFNNERITQDNSLTEALSRSRIGAVVSLRVLRGEQVLAISVKLVERSAD